MEMAAVAAQVEPARAEAGALAGRLRRRFRQRLALGWYTKAVNIGLRRAITAEDAAFVPPPNLTLVPMSPELRDRIFPADMALVPEGERADIADRRRLHDLLPDNGHVVLDDATGDPCYAMWILTYADRRIVERLEGFPPIEPHQAYMEGAYVPPAMRGRKLMTPAGLLAMAKAAEGGATEGICFIGEINTPSLKGALRAGFKPFLRHHRHHFLFGLLSFERFVEFRATDRLPLD